MSEQIDYPLSSPLDELSEWQRVVRPLRVSADGYLRLATNRLSVDSDYTWEMHRHSDHELLWAIDGVLEVRTPKTVYTVPSGVSLWIPSYVPHEVTARSGTELSCTWLVASDVTGLDRVVALSTPPLLEQVLDHLTRDDLTDAARRRAEAFAIDLVEPVPRLIFDVPLPTTPWLRQIADQLVASPADTRSVEEWATDAKVSTRTLTRRFPAETGLTFSEWRMRLRAHHAMQLLALGRSISFVSRKTGFRSESAFGAAFRRTMGVTPGEFASLIDHPRAPLTDWLQD
ncbi:helix-turn-helix transcriptional regulator [Rhodococcus erythropolis]|uniref:helix-turn-helix transcriptional regulator n=1 Tax=Rhodococcus erythropolis TaxID=1833 RepID=UPI0024B70D00|nr:AraC family transcriptional regulator [Rhodococcus erythropolis]MDJ0011943.1 AraC family transcriptional regulator [Rhodococcus erythropolis]